MTKSSTSAQSTVELHPLGYSTGRSTRNDPSMTPGQKRSRERRSMMTIIKFLLLVGLGVLSWLATYTGMLELIVANTGEVSQTVQLSIAFCVAMLMLMIIWILDQLFQPLSIWVRGLYTIGYVLLTLISVGFGFGFYWKVLQSRAEATMSAESAVSQVQNALQLGQTRLEQLQTTFAALTTLSTEKAERERTQGGTCPNSPPGDGPRRRLRDNDAQTFQFAGEFVKTRVEAVRNDIAALNADLTKVITRAPETMDANGTRNQFLREMNRKLDLTITRFNAFRGDPQLAQIQEGLAKRAEQARFDDGRGGTFACPDTQLQVALRGAVRAIAEMPQLDNAEIATVEGSEAIIEAFRRLTVTTVGAMSFQLPPSPERLRELQQEAVSKAEKSPKDVAILEASPGLGDRDYIPLLVALFVDFCILLVSINRPLNRFSRLFMESEAAQEVDLHRIISDHYKVHSREEGERLNILHEVMFDHLQRSYVAVPLDVPPASDYDLAILPDEAIQRGGDGGAERESAAERRSRQRAEMERAAFKQKVVAARYLASLFATLEASGYVSRSRGGLSTSAIQEKLANQGSRFATSRTFRVYKVERKAWPAIVLHEITGAAKKIEEKELLERQAMDTMIARRERVHAAAIGHTSYPSLEKREPYMAELIQDAEMVTDAREPGSVPQNRLGAEPARDLVAEALAKVEAAEAFARAQAAARAQAEAQLLAQAADHKTAERKAAAPAEQQPASPGTVSEPQPAAQSAPAAAARAQTVVDALAHEETRPAKPVTGSRAETASQYASQPRAAVPPTRKAPAEAPAIVLAPYVFAANDGQPAAHKPGDPATGQEATVPRVSRAEAVQFTDPSSLARLAGGGAQGHTTINIYSDKTIVAGGADAAPHIATQSHAPNSFAQADARHAPALTHSDERPFALPYHGASVATADETLARDSSRDEPAYDRGQDYAQDDPQGLDAYDQRYSEAGYGNEVAPDYPQTGPQASLDHDYLPVDYAPVERARDDVNGRPGLVSRPALDLSLNEGINVAKIGEWYSKRRK